MDLKFIFYNAKKKEKEEADPSTWNRVSVPSQLPILNFFITVFFLCFKFLEFGTMDWYILSGVNKKKEFFVYCISFCKSYFHVFSRTEYI